MRNYHGGNFCYSSLLSIFLVYDLKPSNGNKENKNKKKNTSYDSKKLSDTAYYTWKNFTIPIRWKQGD